LSQATYFSLPLVDICHVQADSVFSFSRFIRTTNVANFFIQGSARKLFRYRSRGECLYPNILSKIHTEFLQGHLQHHGFF
ncbi:hypothetical protein BCV72DRAFT_188004, partial [Rhizopus microsporus var. microsporus]